MSDEITPPPKRKRGNPAMVKGGPSINPLGKPRGISAFQIRLREDHDVDEMSAICKAIYRGEPFVRVADANGMPRLASAPIRAGERPGYERPKPASMLKPGERVVEVVYPTPAEQLGAIKMVFDYQGYKPSSEVNMNVDHTSTVLVEADLENFTDEQLEEYMKLCNVLQRAKDGNVPEEGHFIEATSSEKKP